MHLYLFYLQVSITDLDLYYSLFGLINESNLAIFSTPDPSIPILIITNTFILRVHFLTAIVLIIRKFHKLLTESRLHHTYSRVS